MTDVSDNFACSIQRSRLTAPLRGIPSQNASKISGGFTNEPKKFTRPSLKRDGGAKLIEIAETPQALKRKRKEWGTIASLLRKRAD
jgi:hypothetical protein